MSQDQKYLTPELQKKAFLEAMAQHLLSTDQGQPQTTPDPAAQVSASPAPASQDGGADYSTIQNLFRDASSGHPVAMQDGDKMHPMDAIQQISSQMMGPVKPAGIENTGGAQIRANAPASGLIPRLLGQKTPGLSIQTPEQGLLPRLLGMKNSISVNAPNYAQAAQQAGIGKYLPSGLAQMPDGTPFVDKATFEQALLAKKAGETPSNPPVTKDQFVAWGFGTAKEWEKAGFKDTDAVPLTTVREKTAASMAGARQNMAANMQLKTLLQYGGVGAVQQAASDAYSRLSNLTRADGIYKVIDTLQTGNADRRQRNLYLMEIARAINPSGVITNEALNNLATDTAGQKINDWKEWFLNQATPTDFKGFLPSLKSLADQEVDINRHLYTEASNMGLSVIKSVNPDGAGVGAAAVQANPVVNPPASSGMPSPANPGRTPPPSVNDPDIIAYAKKYKISLQTALKTKLSRMGR